MNKKGFTLIELLVVIAIIGLLSTLAVVSLNNARSKSRDAKRVADVKQIQTALELYYNDCNNYPETLATTASNGCPSGTTLGTFMAQIPSAPTPADGSCTSAQNTYTYTASGDANCDGSGNDGTCSSYTLTFCLGSDTGELSSGPRTATPSGIQ